ncbi:hypothetical protein Taro_037412 [Colocasia esculenta]|uniref:U-box domain-containing protein n=1 Tax=Colocasia esculenta TaxID=4460 RepID=A0A843WPM2_COLES|nr:hypothetical protein [Colocasia esculenta]
MPVVAGLVWVDGSAERGEGGPKTSDARNHEILARVQSDDEDCRVRAAIEIRLLTKASSKHREELAEAIEPLVEMLRLGARHCRVAALLALLNLAVKNERNKAKIVDAGALEPLTGFLQSTDTALLEHATAAILTLSAASINKPRIGTAGALPPLVNVLSNGNRQARVDAVLALYNLSTVPGNLAILLSVKPVPPLVDLLKSCRKSSKTAEKCCALLESLLNFDEGRTALTAEEGGVLALVEALEEGSLQGREHAVGALLTMCESDRRRYREVILGEGVVPGLLELTAEGTPKSRSQAHALLKLLRDSPDQRTELKAETLETIVCSIVSQVDSEECGEKAVKMLAEMVQVSMEQSLRHLQKRASTCTTPSKLAAPLRGCPPHEVPSK